MTDEATEQAPALPEEGDWGVLELMGHVRTAGFVSETLRFGATLGRIDIPDGKGYKTQLFNGSAIYRFTPCTEELARAVARQSNGSPLSSWEEKHLLGSPDDHEEAHLQDGEDDPEPNLFEGDPEEDRYS